MAGAAPASGAAELGLISGRIDGAIPATGHGEASVRVYDVNTGALLAIGDAQRRGQFRLRLPAGGYLLHAVTVGERGVLRERLLPVSLRAGARRTGLRIRVASTAHAAPAGGLPAPSATSAPGITTYRLDDLTGETAYRSALGRGLSALVAADVRGNESCSALQLADPRAGALIAQPQRLRAAATFARNTPLHQALLAPQIVVSGSLSAGSRAERSAFTIRILDAASGATIDTLHGGVRNTGRGLFTDQRRVAAALAERICRRPRSYRVALAITARGDYTAYNATATLASTAVARTRTAAPYASWSGGAGFTWGNVLFRSRVSLCKVTKVTPGSGNWSTTVTALPDAKVQVALELTASEYTAYPKAEFACEPGLASVTGAPGPLLTGTAPRTFTLPAGGGTGTIASTTTLPTGGLLQNGSLTLTPVWGHALPGV
jgi:hypothetical protein